MKDANGMAEKDYANDDNYFDPLIVVAACLAVAILIALGVATFFFGVMRP
jgi:preprotein translocase subunit Sec61beta